MKSKAAILVELNKPLVIEEIEIPALQFGQVLVKVICSGICGAQINEIEGAKGPDNYLPHLLGHEATAEVLDVGEGVNTVKKGDRVVMHWRKGDGIHSPTPKYKSRIGDINAGWVTTFNEMSIVSENRVTRVPESLDPEVGAMMGCAVTTAMGVINNDSKLKIGESIVIFGAGGVGLNMVQAAQMVSAHPIVAVDLYDNKLELAKSLGATHIINASINDPAKLVKEIVGDKGADVVIDNTGNPRVIEIAYQCTNNIGRTILVGVPRKGNDTTLYTLPLHFEKVLTGSEGGSCLPERDIPRYVRLHEAGKLDLKSIIGQRYKLEEVNRAIEDMKAGRIAGRCMIYMD